MSKEYDFRFYGLAPIGSKDKENALRVRAVRYIILKFAAGFTEIPPDRGTDMIPGAGLGYIVALNSRKQSARLEAALRRLARGWHLPEPSLWEAAKGPRRDFIFFLIPELANPTGPVGYRRPLFRPSSWARIHESLERVSTYHVELVYGEWLPNRPGRPVLDPSRMFIIKGASAVIHQGLKRFIRMQVFDGGIECDQACIYLSCGGVSKLVFEE